MNTLNDLEVRQTRMAYTGSVEFGCVTMIVLARDSSSHNFHTCIENGELNCYELTGVVIDIHFSALSSVPKHPPYSDTFSS